MNTFYKLVDEIAEHKDQVKEVYLHTDGEPLLAPDIEKRMRYIKGKGIAKLVIVTNASNLTPAIADAMISCKVDAVVCSCEGPPAEVYESVRPPLQFNHVRDNILMLSAKRYAKGALLPFVVVRSVLNDARKKYLHEYRSYWKGKVSGISILEEHSWVGANSAGEQTPSTQLFPCNLLFDTMIIHHNGDVPMCCMDYNGNHKMGNAYKDGIQAVWNASSFSLVRKAHEVRGVHVPTMCQHCSLRDDVTNKPLSWPLYKN